MRPWRRWAFGLHHAQKDESLLGGYIRLEEGQIQWVDDQTIQGSGKPLSGNKSLWSSPTNDGWVILPDSQIGERIYVLLKAIATE